MVRKLIVTLVGTAWFGAGLAVGAGHAQTIYPLDRAQMVVGARFDMKVEFPGSPAAGTV